MILILNLDSFLKFCAFGLHEFWWIYEISLSLLLLTNWRENFWLGAIWTNFKSNKTYPLLSWHIPKSETCKSFHFHLDYVPYFLLYLFTNLFSEYSVNLGLLFTFFFSIQIIYRFQWQENPFSCINLFEWHSKNQFKEVKS